MNTPTRSAGRTADGMSFSIWQWVALSLYGVVLAGTVARHVLVHVIIRRTPFLTPASPRWEGDDAPKVTILVPAKDEAANIESCLDALLAQDYPNFEILVVDDRSDDETAAIAEAVARRDARVRVLRIRELPPGWTGKTHALHFAQRRAHGEWLLFVDADARLHPDCLSVSVRDAIDHDAGLFSLLPRMEMDSFWERAVQPIAATLLMVLFPLPRVNDQSRADGGFANGQFLMMRRTAYDAIGGHEAVKDKFVEDVNLGRLIKRNRLGLRVVIAPELAAVRMYASLPQIMRGWSRIFYAAADASALLLWGFMAALFGLTALPYVVLPGCLVAAGVGAACPFLWTLVGVAAIHEVLQTLLYARAYHAGGSPMRSLVWRWLGTGVMLVVLRQTIRLCRTHQVVWRGTSYAGALNQSAGLPVAATARVEEAAA